MVGDQLGDQFTRLGEDHLSASLYLFNQSRQLGFSLRNVGYYHRWILLQRAQEKFPGARPRIISDNGPQFIAKDFKEFIRISGMTHVRTSPYYLKSNGRLERWNGSI